MKTLIAALLSLALVAPALAQKAPAHQEFKNYGFTIDYLPVILTQEKTTTAGKDANGNPTKIDFFKSDLIEFEDGSDRMFSVRVETFGVAVDKGVDANYLVQVLKSMTDETTTMGKPKIYPMFPLTDNQIAVRAMFTDTHKDGTKTYMSTLVTIKGNRFYVLRALYTKDPGADDTESDMFFVTFKLL